MEHALRYEHNFYMNCVFNITGYIGKTQARNYILDLRLAIAMLLHNSVPFLKRKAV